MCALYLTCSMVRHHSLLARLIMECVDLPPSRAGITTARAGEENHLLLLSPPCQPLLSPPYLAPSWKALQRPHSHHHHLRSLQLVLPLPLLPQGRASSIQILLLTSGHLRLLRLQELLLIAIVCWCRPVWQRGRLAQLEGMFASGKHLPPSLLSPGNAIAAAFMDERERSLTRGPTRQGSKCRGTKVKGTVSELRRREGE